MHPLQIIYVFANLCQLPKFPEKDPKMFFSLFEQVAE